MTRRAMTRQEKQSLIDYINSKYNPHPQLTIANTQCSRTSKDNRYWHFKISENRFTRLLNLLLENYDNNWAWICIPSNHFANPTETFEPLKRNQVRLRISCDSKSYLKITNYKNNNDQDLRFLERFIKQADIPYSPAIEGFDRRRTDTAPPMGTERDGISYARNGEGPNHKALREWVTNNPDQVHSDYTDFETDTEVELASADRVDVVYRGPASTVVIEVKSLDSNHADLRRGVFQCIKYRAVTEAMDERPKRKIIPVLVTQTPLPRPLRDLAQRHGITHFQAPRTLG